MDTDLSQGSQENGLYHTLQTVMVTHQCQLFKEKIATIKKQQIPARSLKYHDVSKDMLTMLEDQAIKNTLKSWSLFGDMLTSPADKATENALKYWSLFSYHAMEVIIKKHGTEEDKENLSKYKQLLSTKACALEHPDTTTYNSTIKMYITMKSGMPKWNEIERTKFIDDFQKTLKISTNLDFIPESSNGEKSLENLEFAFSVPYSIITERFPLSSEQEEKLALSGIDRIWFMYQFHGQKSEALKSQTSPCTLTLQDKDQTTEHNISDPLAKGLLDLGTVMNATWEARKSWINIGLGLGLGLDDLEVIEKDRKEVADCFREMLHLRFKSGPTLTWKLVIEALKSKSVNLNELADQLTLKYIMCCKPTSGIGNQAATSASIDNAEPVLEFNNSAYLSYNFNEELTKVKNNFLILQKNVRKSLRKKRVSPQRIYSSALAYSRLSLRGQEASWHLILADYDIEKLRTSKNIDEAFAILCKYWTFLEHGMLLNIVDEFEDKKAKTKILQYQEELKQFFINRKVKDIQVTLTTDSASYSETHTGIEVKLNEDDSMWPDVVNLKDKIGCILGIHPLALLIAKIEPGCVKITFLTLRSIAKENILKRLTSEQIKELKKTSIVSLSCEYLLFRNDELAVLDSPKQIPAESTVIDSESSVILSDSDSNSDVTGEQDSSSLQLATHTQNSLQSDLRPDSYVSEIIDEENSPTISASNDSKYEVASESGIFSLSTKSISEKESVVLALSETSHRTQKTSTASESGICSTADAKDSFIKVDKQGVTDQQNVSLVEDISHTRDFSMDDLQDEPYLKLTEEDTTNLLPPDEFIKLKLHKASRKGDLDQVKHLVETENFNPHELQRDENGNTALHYAAAGGHVNILVYFIREQGCTSACRNKVGLTPLHIAALVHNLEVIEYLIEGENMEPSDKDREGFTPLHRACMSGDLKVVRYLVRKMEDYGDEINSIIYCSTNIQNNPVHYAALKGHTQIVKFFISELNYNPNTQGYLKRTILQCAALGGHIDTFKYLTEEVSSIGAIKFNEEDSVLHLAAKHGCLDIVKYLTQTLHCNLLSWDSEGKSPLSYAALCGHDEVVKFIASNAKDSPNFPDKDGRIPLHAAVKGGHVNIVKYFIIQGGCDPSFSTSEDKCTPLHVAAQHGHINIVKYLTQQEKCSKPLSRNENGDTPLNLAALYGHLEVVKFFITELNCDPNTPGQYNRTPLHSAAQQGYQEVVSYLIEEQQCSSSCSLGKDKVTPLHLAAKYGHIHIVKYLSKDKSSDPLSQSVENESPLTSAASSGHLEILKYFIKDLQCDPGFPGPLNRTSLHLAAENGHLDVVEYLIKDCKCDPSSNNNDNKVTPLHLAALGGHLDVVTYLTKDKRCNPLSLDKYHYIPLHYAAIRGHLQVVKYFVENCKCPPNISAHEGDTPLDLAKNEKHNHVVKYLNSMQAFSQ